MNDSYIVFVQTEYFSGWVICKTEGKLYYATRWRQVTVFFLTRLFVLLPFWHLIPKMQLFDHFFLNTVKQSHCKILLKLKITYFFCFKWLWNIFYSCDGKTWKTITPLDGDKWVSFECYLQFVYVFCFWIYLNIYKYNYIFI